MDIRLAHSTVFNLLDGLRRAGYFPFRDPKTGEESFVCRLGSDFYPRFHLYIKQNDATYTLSLHLDQKQASYGGSHMHNGEYEGEHIEKELQRIQGWLTFIPQEASASVESPQHSSKQQNQKTSWWKLWK